MSNQTPKEIRFEVVYQDSAGHKHADFESMRSSKELNSRLLKLEAEKPKAAPALSRRAEAGYLAVIAALAHALADCRPELRKDGRPFPGYSKDTGDAGIVGYLKQNNYTERSPSDLQKKISDASRNSKNPAKSLVPSQLDHQRSTTSINCVV
jgi:hypothetical protein